MDQNPSGEDARAVLRLASNAAMALILQGRVVEARVEGRLQELDLSLRRLGLLGHLRATPGISYSELARRAGIKVQSRQPIIQTMTGLGYVQTVGGVGQGRAAVLELTPQGGDVLDRATEALTEIDGELFAQGDWKDLGDALVRVTMAFMNR